MNSNQIAQKIQDFQDLIKINNQGISEALIKSLNKESYDPSETLSLINEICFNLKASLSEAVLKWEDKNQKFDSIFTKFIKNGESKC